MNASESSPEAALDKLFELALRLGEVTQAGLAERGLTASRAEVLLVLDEHGPMVQRRIGEALRCTPRYVTALIDGLEAEGLVGRARHPTDRRATVVSLTKRGSAAAARMVAERQQAAGWLLGNLPPEDLAAFVSVANQVLARIAAAAPDAGQEKAVPPKGGPIAHRRPAPASARGSRATRQGGQSKAHTRRKEDG